MTPLSVFSTLRLALRKGQVVYMTFMLLLSFIPCVVLIVLNGVGLHDVLVLQDELIMIQQSVGVSQFVAPLCNG